jgi:hypothetical protein
VLLVLHRSSLLIQRVLYEPNSSGWLGRNRPAIRKRYIAKWAEIAINGRYFEDSQEVVNRVFHSHVAVIHNASQRMNIWRSRDAGVPMDGQVKPLISMNRNARAPSPRLVRAATAERTELERHRVALIAERDRIREQLRGVEEAIAETDEHLVLLQRIAGPPKRPDEAPKRNGDERELHGRRTLRGPDIRTTAVRVLLDQPEQPEAIHYRQWFELMGIAGFAVAGKDPLAVFLTQISRSPVIRRGTQAGVYELDRQAPPRLRTRLEGAKTDLRLLTANSAGATTDLASVRDHRAALVLEIDKLEKALEEAEQVLRRTPFPPIVAAVG